jgi:hypothetical protein
MPHHLNLTPRVIQFNTVTHHKGLRNSRVIRLMDTLTDHRVEPHHIRATQDTHPTIIQVPIMILTWEALPLCLTAACHLHPELCRPLLDLTLVFQPKW